MRWPFYASKKSLLGYVRVTASKKGSKMLSYICLGFTGAFVQMVWTDSREIGVGLAEEPQPKMGPSILHVCRGRRGHCPWRIFCHVEKIQV